VIDMMRAPLARLTTGAAVVALLGGGLVLLAPGVAGAKDATNTFTLKGAYNGTLKLSPSSLNCSYGKTANGKSYLVTLSHMKGTITGAGVGPGAWTVTAYVPKEGTTHVASANVHALNDTSFQNAGQPITVFDETAGTITDKGSKGSMNISVEFHALSSPTYGGTTTVTGSWNCGSQGLNLG
jgi:hypothetical protein